MPRTSESKLQNLHTPYRPYKPYTTYTELEPRIKPTEQQTHSYSATSTTSVTMAQPTGGLQILIGFALMFFSTLLVHGPIRLLYETVESGDAIVLSILIAGALWIGGLITLLTAVGGFSEALWQRMLGLGVMAANVVFLVMVCVVQPTDGYDYILNGSLGFYFGMIATILLSNPSEWEEKHAKTTRS
ncbi:hypothetical protein F5884DRAFT_748588 [Xylogone sp. PMI_703]|nr:hypothetical protein F5884DRAFT_748588 [Xylogone sp. PMI_703]